MTEVLLANAYIKGASDLLQGKIEGMPKVVVIPDNATNKEVMCAVFPKATLDKCMCIDMEWWNAPYKREVEE